MRSPVSRYLGERVPAWRCLPGPLVGGMTPNSLVSVDQNSGYFLVLSITLFHIHATTSHGA